MFINGSEDTAAVFGPLLKDLRYEEIWIAILDAKSRIITKVRIASGSSDSVSSSISDIFREVILNRGNQIVVVHNHPTDDVEPSIEDIEFTTRLYEASRIFKIHLKDHVIIGESEYFSMAESGLLKHISDKIRNRYGHKTN